MTTQQKAWEGEIQSAQTLADIFAVLLEMKQRNVVVKNDKGNELDAAYLADSTYGGICSALKELNHDPRVSFSDQFSKISRVLELRSTVIRIFRSYRLPDGTLPESMIMPTLPLAVMGETYARNFYKVHKVGPREPHISFDNCDSLADIFAVLYEMQGRGRLVLSRSSKTYEPEYVAEQIYYKCKQVKPARPFDINIYTETLRTIPSEPRIALMRILKNSSGEVKRPRALAQLVFDYQSLPEVQQEVFDPNPTEFARPVEPRRGRENLAEPVPARRERVSIGKKPGWLGVAAACAVTLATGVGAWYAARSGGFGSSGDDEGTPLSTPDMMEGLKKSMTQREEELRANQPAEWHNLTAHQKDKIKQLLEKGEKYYLPFAIELIKASREKMNKDGNLTTDSIDAVTDLKMLAQTLQQYYNLDRIRGFDVKKKSGDTGIVLGQMQGGGETPNNFADDVFVVYLPALDDGTLQPWVLFHENAHGFKGGEGHKGDIAKLPRDQAVFANVILGDKDYAYYTTCLMNTVDYIRSYYQENFEASLREVHTSAEQQSLYELYLVKPGHEKHYAQYMAKLFFEIHKNTSLMPLGITQAELAHTIKVSNIFELTNESVERRFREAQRELKEHKETKPKKHHIK